MRVLILAAVACLPSASSIAAAGEFDRPIPQNIAKIRQQRFESLMWTRRTLAEPYEKVGKKSPKWDGLVYELMKVAVPLLVMTDDGSTHDDVFRAAKKAVDAGCDDPIVLFIYARASTGRNDFGERERRFALAATAMETSKYPPIRRATAMIRAGQFRLAHPEPEARKEALRLFDAALALLPESAKVEGVSLAWRRAWHAELVALLSSLTWMMGDSKSAYDKIDAALARVPATGQIRLAFRGHFYIDYAWEARGNAVASRVTEDGFRRFAERIAESRKALQEAWSIHQDDGIAAAMMITVETAVGEGDRAEMEKWFTRAMEADGDNFDACWRKLNWLEPKWHGSVEEMINFARACRDTRNYPTRIGLLSAQVHYRLAQHLPLEAKVKYYQQPEVWVDVSGPYLECLKEEPDNDVARSEYAGFCYLCSHYDEAHAQFEKLGTRLDRGTIFSEAWLKETRLATAERVRGEIKPGTRGFAVLYAGYGAGDSWLNFSNFARVSVVNDRLGFKPETLPDPIDGTFKSVAVTYLLDGKAGLLTAPQNLEVSLPEKAPKLVEVPPQGFSVLIARFGDADKWVDVTETFRKRTAAGKLDSSAADLPDPAFGIHKVLVIVYAWEGRVFTSITRDDRPVKLPVLQPPGVR